MMSFDAAATIALPSNEAVKSYAPGSPERAAIKARLETMARERIELPKVVGANPPRTGKHSPCVMPHAHVHVLADAHMAGRAEIEAAIAAALKARTGWSAMG